MTKQTARKHAGKHTHTHLALVRHGESVWNIDGKWTGWQDVPLSENGKHEAKKAAKLVADIAFHVTASSDLMRAFETLSIMKQELGIAHLPTIQDPAFRERHYGIYTGKNKWELQKTFGAERFKKIRRGWNEPIEQGETLKDVYARVIPKFLEMVSPHITGGRNVLFVAHGNTNRAIIKHLENISDEAIAEIEMVTGEVVVYKLDEKGRVVTKEKRNTTAK